MCVYVCVLYICIFYNILYLYFLYVYIYLPHIYIYILIHNMLIRKQCWNCKAIVIVGRTGFSWPWKNNIFSKPEVHKIKASPSHSCCGIKEHSTSISFPWLEKCSKERATNPSWRSFSVYIFISVYYYNVHR